jgi:hypothetical protein
MTRRSEYYLEKADLCLENARRTALRDVSDQWQELAEDWQFLAEEAIRRELMVMNR